MKNVLVIGALGQIGSELTPALQNRHGVNNVIATDIHLPRESLKLEADRFQILDVLDSKALNQLLEKEKISEVYHLASLLSAVGEKNPQKAWEINANGTFQVLEACRAHQVEKVFLPSSIAAFGMTTPLNNTPQDTLQRPNSMYGITKVMMELLGDYYFQRYGMDCRGVRFPGILSYKTPPGGGTTDYAVDMLFHAAKKQHYTCYLRADTSLDMMYMDDAVEAVLQLMQTPSESLLHRNAFNVTAVSFTPEALQRSIQRHFPSFQVEYKIDPIRQAIADSWPNSMDDSCARNEWGWSPHFDCMDRIVDEMMAHL